MYLSRLVLNPRSRVVRRDLADCQSLHRTVLSAFPVTGDGVGARAEFGVLHRLEPSRFGTAPALLVQSAEAPDWSRLPPEYLAPAVSDTVAAVVSAGGFGRHKLVRSFQTAAARLPAVYELSWRA